MIENDGQKIFSVLCAVFLATAQP